MKDQSARAGRSAADRNRQPGNANTTPAAPVFAVPGWWSWAAAAAGGVLSGPLAFNPVGLRPLIVLAPLGCFLAVRWSPTPRAAFLRAWAFGWIYFFGALHWLLTIGQWAQPEILGLFGVVALAAYLGLYPALTGFILRKWLWTRCTGRQFALFAALWLLSEWVRTLGKLAMPLAQLGHAWATVPWAIQIAAWLGELGVSLEVLFLAGLIFLSGRWLVLRVGSGVPASAGIPPDDISSQRIIRTLSRLIAVLTVLAVAWGVSSLFIARAWERRVRDALRAPPARLLNVGLVQPNIPQELKLASYGSPDENTRLALQQQIRERTEAMLAKWAHGQYDLILLPETAYTEIDFNLNEPLRQRVSQTVRAAGADVLVSASRWVSEREFYNTAYFVRRDGTFDPRWYDKMRLVPFGENLPYCDWIPGVRSVVGILPFSEGTAQTLFTTKGFRFGVLICFESTFSSLGRGLARAGADFLAVVTNDAWYGMSAGASNHHDLSLLRAVETRRWVLRCANTGISSIVTPAGRIAVYDTARGPVRATMALGQQGFLEGTIAPDVYHGRTPFAAFGNAWMILAALAVGLGAVAGRREKNARGAIRNAG